MDHKLDFLTKELIDKAVLEIDKNGVPSNREGTDYAVPINGENYPFKLLITEAAILADIDLTSADFSSNANYRALFEDITGYSIFQLKQKVIFKNLDELIERINSDLRSKNFQNFCFSFHHFRKIVFNKMKISHKTKVFNLPKNDANYVFHLGGSLELQLHVFLRNNLIGYGLGFNTQFVQNRENIPTIEYTEPIAKAFLSDPSLENRLMKESFNYEIGNHSMLENLIPNNYVLIGKTIKVQIENEQYNISDIEYQKMLSDFTGVLFETYKEVCNIIVIKNNMNKEIEDFISLLEYKNQIILQGPPGTGKTYTAKDIAEQLLTGNISDNKKSQAHILQQTDQFELVQFHPSYTYEDFVRGIVVESKDNKVAYKTKDKTLGLFAKKALENFNLSRSENTEAVIKKWIDEKFEEFKNQIEVNLEQEELGLSGDITVFDIGSTSFKYGKNWKISSNMNFSEFKKLIKAVIDGKITVSNQQMSKDISVHAHYRYTYYNALLKMFFDQFPYSAKSESVAEKKYVLIIDEINRANLPSVLGELIYALEYRNQNVKSMYALDNEDQEIQIPENLYIIGTMNTADRSVGHIDYAIRRRFAFVELLPKELTALGDQFKLETFKTVSSLFVKEIKTDGIDLEASEHLSPEFAERPQDIWLGHSYFIVQKDEDGNEIDFNLRLEYEIIPILEEYMKDGILKNSIEVKEIIKGLKE